MKRHRFLNVGTQSVLWGAHCFFIHPIFVFIGWWKLYGFPWDPRLWVAFFVHDLGYWGKSAMDLTEGEMHVEFGARLMTSLFDPRADPSNLDRENTWIVRLLSGKLMVMGSWGMLCLLHSRYYSKRLNLPVSRLCLADKLAITLEPWWLYLPRVYASGEVYEYLQYAQGRTKTAHGEDPTSEYAKNSQTARGWHREMSRYLRAWVDEHRDLGEDTWTRGSYGG